MTVVPQHIAIVMDGNGRWAKRRGLPRIAGHHAGVKSVRRVIKDCNELGIGALSLFAFSRENWNRPPEEIDNLMRLFVQILQRDVKKLHKNNVKIRVIGDLSPLANKLQDGIQAAHELTAGNTGLQVNMAINYSGKWDIAQAAKQLAAQVVAGKLAIEQVDEATLAPFISLAELPEPDLFIRTSGELRISNFMLWQLAYTELYFTDTLWPDFNKKALLEAISSYDKRDRRFGGVKKC